MKRFLIHLFSVILISGLVISCKKFYDPPQVFEEGQEKAIPKKRKVLLIVAEGATAAAMQQIKPPNITALLEHAKYSWNSFGDPNTTEGGAWVGLTAGKTSSNYGKVDSTLNISNDEEGEEEHGDIHYIPNYSQRLLAAGKVGVAGSKMVVISPWQTLLDVPFKFADRKIYAADDAAVTTAAVEALDDANITHMVVDLTGPNLVGRSEGFDPANARYKAAITAVDGYIGDIMEALKARPTYAAEDWLVILTTTHGVTPDNLSYGGSSIPERQIFTIYYNDSIQGQEFFSPDLTNGLQLDGKAAAVSLAADQATAYDIPATGGYTIMCRVRHISKSGSNTAILSKSTHFYGNPMGWGLSVMGAGTKSYRFGIGDKTSSNGNTYKYYIGQGATEASAEVNIWDAVALRVYDSAGSRYAVVFTNGVPGTAVEIGNIASAATTTDLVVGNMSSSLGTNKAIVSNISIWNTALTATEIRNGVCAANITSEHPQYAHLIGYWPMDEGEGTVLKNYAPGAAGNDFSFNGFGGRSWNLLEQPCSITDNTFQTSSLDIVPTIFYWFNTSTQDVWGLEGTPWLKNYEIEFVSQ